ncbi:MAG: peptide chain release factor N(5)-glutamine methyltransferase [Aristaeellaceae bacterium]
MTPRQLIRETAAQFRQAGIPDPEVDSAALLSHVTGRPPLMLRLDTDTALTDTELAAFGALRQRRLQRIPLQYLTHEQPFLGHSFYVDERVLIPRPETELLAERVIGALRAMDAPAALDLCCGSGCIGISAALAVPGARVHAADLSPDALAVTRRNAEALGASVTLHQGDLFDAVAGLRFDLIVSNPPYIPADECARLQAEVLREPVMALDGGADGLDFYRRIAREAPAHLTAGGMVFLEVGWDQADAVCALLREAGFREATAHEDLQGILRMVEARL